MDALDRYWTIFFQALYPSWSLIGWLVVWTYGRVAHRSWREAGGRWFHAPAEWFGVLRWIVLGCLRDLLHLVALKRLPHEPPFPTEYTPGHLLRFFVVLSFGFAAVASAVTWGADRTSWPDWMLFITAGTVSVSMIAGWGHLFIAWRQCPRCWRWVVFVTAASVPVSFLLRY